MSHAAGRMPLSAKMDIFYTKISGDQKVETGGRPQDGTIIADTLDDCPVAAGLSQAADAFD